MAAFMLLFIMFIPPHHHHGGTVCFASDIHASHEGPCTDPEHHCDKVPDAGDPCIVFIKSAFIQSSKAAQGEDVLPFLPLSALCPVLVSVAYAAETSSLIYKSDGTFLCYSPAHILSRRGPPVWG